VGKKAFLNGKDMKDVPHIRVVNLQGVPFNVLLTFRDSPKPIVDIFDARTQFPGECAGKLVSRYYASTLLASRKILESSAPDSDHPLNYREPCLSLSVANMREICEFIAGNIPEHKADVAPAQGRGQARVLDDRWERDCEELSGRHGDAHSRLARFVVAIMRQAQEQGENPAKLLESAAWLYARDAARQVAGDAPVQEAPAPGGA
jgi:hypothetical protein